MLDAFNQTMPSLGGYVVRVKCARCDASSGAGDGDESEVRFLSHPTHTAVHSCSTPRCGQSVSMVSVVSGVATSTLSVTGPLHRNASISLDAPDLCVSNLSFVSLNITNCFAGTGYSPSASECLELRLVLHCPAAHW